MAKNNISLELSKEEYIILLKMLYIADTVIEASREEEDDLNDYLKVFNKALWKASENDLEDYVDMDLDEPDILPSEMLDNDSEIEDFLTEHQLTSFIDVLPRIKYWLI